MIWKALFSALGLGSLLYILNGYGFHRIALDLASLGFWSIPLALSFLPVVTCYALAWLLVTPELPLSMLPRFTRLSIISIAWNNLSPFVKVLGEPVRVVLLEDKLDRKSALQSVVLYNLIHSIGTLCAFFLGSCALLLFFPISSAIRTGLLLLVIVSLLLALLLYFFPLLVKARKEKRRAKKSRVAQWSYWLRWSLSRIRLFSKKNLLRFWLAVGMEIVARFAEGITFYIAFLALGKPVPILTCAILDVGRALMDNLFFFVPYQVGSREGGIVLLAQHGVQIETQAAISAAVFYRLVELVWMGLGYIFWIAASKTRKVST